MEGVTPDEYKRMQRDMAEAQRKLINTELELRAAQDKLEVYRFVTPFLSIFEGSTGNGMGTSTADGSMCHKHGEC